MDSDILDFPYVWHWRKRLPDRKGQACKLLVKGKMNTIMIEFEDGFRVITSLNAIRKRQINE